MKFFAHVNNKWVVLLLVLLCLAPVFCAFFVWRSIGMPLYMAIGVFTLSFSLFLLPFLLFKMRTAFFITFLWVILAPIEIGSLLFYKYSAISGLILFILKSNYHEATEFLLSHKLFVGLYLLVLVLYPVLVAKFAEKKPLFTYKRVKYGLLGSILLFFILLYAYSVKIAYHPAATFAQHQKLTNKIFNLKFTKIYPYNTILAIYNGINTFVSFRSTNRDAADFTFHVSQIKTIDEREIYVLVVGETARYANFGINGYGRETTPLLEKTPNLFSFTNVLSEANSTEFSLPILLTRADAQDFFRFKKEKGIADAFKEAGFRTYWIANQSFGSSFVERMALGTDEKFFTPQDFDDESNFDEKLWEHIDKVLQKNEKKQFLVIHTLGSHFRYNQRYPASYEKFVPALKGLTGHLTIGEGLKAELINSYDNSILYTDYFLANTIKKLAQTNTVSYLLYISDHGESLFDNNVIFHGSANPVPNEIHVPMFIWTSDKYVTQHPEKITALKKNIDKKTTSAVVFHSLLDMANIRTPNFPEKYITNIHLQSDSVRYMMNPENQIIPIKW